MDWEEIFFGLFMFAVVVVPVFGITARFALAPLLETLIRLRESTSKQSVESDRQLLRLTQEVQRLTAAVQRLEEGSAFDREIRRATDRQLTPGDTP